MKALAVLLLAVAASMPAAAAERSAPPFSLPGTAGPVKLEAYKGKVVYLDFWASWCGPCRQSFPWMNEMQAKYGSKGLQIVGVNVDAKAEDAKAFLANTRADFVVAFDSAGTTPKSYAIKGMPSSVLIGPDGKVLFEHSGFRPADRAELEKQIAGALGAKP